MNCNKCGNYIPDNSVFCTACGSPVENRPVVQEQPNGYAQAIPQQPIVEQPVYNQPVINEQPVYSQPVVNEQPVCSQPVINEQPVYSQPVINEQPVYGQQVMNGQPVYGQQVMNGQPVYGQPVYGQPYMMAPKKKSKAPWIVLGVSSVLLIAIIVMVIILVVSCNSDDANDSPQSVITSCLTSAAAGNSETLLSTVYPAIIGRLEDMGYSRSEIYENLRDDIVKEGMSFSNIKLTSNKRSDQDTVSYYNEVFSQYKGYKNISAIYEVNGTLNIKVDGYEWSDPFDATVVLSDGKYYVLDINID